MDSLNELEHMARGALELGFEYDPNEIQPQKSAVVKHYPPSKTYLFLLKDPIGSITEIQRLMPTSEIVEEVEAEDDSGAKFCMLTGTMRSELEKQLPHDFRPTWITRNIASKALSSVSMAPFLGRDYTLPQYRQITALPPQPATGQYPVWYFFYGTLADPDILAKVIGRDVGGELLAATVVGGEIKTWGGKYRALVDSSGKEVAGSAFFVSNQEEENALRIYETDKYEVVRCDLVLPQRHVPGLTFRFAGSDKDLT